MQETSFFPDNYRRYFTEAYENRSLRNPSYSLRALARDLGMGVSTLNELLKGKYGISKRRIEQVAQALELSAGQAEHFADLVAKEHARNPQDREAAARRVQERLQSSVQSITLDGFRAISDWHHLALLELISLPNFTNDTAWMSQRLGVSELTIVEALDRLERLALIERLKGGIRLTEDFSAIGTDTPSQAIRKFHRQILEKALVALETQTIEERESSSTVFAINKEDLPKAKKKLLQFRREFSRLLSTSPKKNNVYCLSIQFFNLLQKENV